MSHHLFNPYAPWNQSSTPGQYGLSNIQADRDPRRASSHLRPGSSLTSPGVPSAPPANSGGMLPSMPPQSMNYMPEQSRAIIDQNIERSVDMHISRAREEVRLLGTPMHQPVDQGARFASTQRDEFLSSDTGRVPYPMSSTSAPPGYRHSGVESGGSSSSWSSNFPTPPAVDPSKLYSSSASSTCASIGDSRFNASSERSPAIRAVPVPDKPVAPTESSKPKYTSELASNILMRCGLEKEDLDLLAHYPEGQITPANLPFILRQIRIDKSKSARASLQSSLGESKTQGSAAAEQMTTQQIQKQPGSQTGQGKWPPVHPASLMFAAGGPPPTFIPPVKSPVSTALPTPTMMNDYAASTPRVFPHTCCLCNKECAHMKDWISHQNTSHHLDSCKLLRTQFPEWGGKVILEPSGAGQDAGPSSSTSSGNSQHCHQKVRHGSRSSSSSPSPRRHRGSKGRREKSRSRSRSSHNSRYTRRSRSRSHSPRYYRSTSSRYRSRSRSSKRQSPPGRRFVWSPQRRTDDRRSARKRSRERRSTSRSSDRRRSTSRSSDRRRSTSRSSDRRRSRSSDRRRSTSRSSDRRRSRSSDRRRSTSRSSDRRRSRSSDRRRSRSSDVRRSRSSDGRRSRSSDGRRSSSRSSDGRRSPQRKKRSSAAILAKKLLETSAAHSLTKDSDLETVVKTLAPALIAELAKVKSKPSLSTTSSWTPSHPETTALHMQQWAVGRPASVEMTAIQTDPFTAVTQMGAPPDNSAPLTVGEMIEQRLTEDNMWEGLSPSDQIPPNASRCQMLITNLPQFYDGCYTEDDLIDLLEEYGYQHTGSGSSIYIIPQKCMALVNMPKLGNLVGRWGIHFKGHQLFFFAVQYNIEMKPICFYKGLMRLMGFNVCNAQDRIVLVSNISWSETAELRETLRKIDRITNFLPLLNKVFIEFMLPSDADRIGVWYSLLKRVPGYEVHRLRGPKAGCTFCPPKLPENALPDSKDAVAGVIIPPTKKGGIPQGSVGPCWVTLSTPPYLFPTVSPWYLIPDHLTVKGQDDIEKARGRGSPFHTVMLTGLPKGYYSHEDVAKLVWPYFQKQNLHILYYNVVVLPLQRRAFVFFPDWTSCCNFVRDHIKNPVSVENCVLSVHFVLQHIGPQSSEEMMYSTLMKWSNAGVPESESLEERLLSVEISEASVEVVREVMEEVASVSTFVSFLPLAKRICIEMAESSGVTKVVEKYNTFSLDSSDTPVPWSKIQHFESVKTLKQRLQDSSEITITFERATVSRKAQTSVEASPRVQRRAPSKPESAAHGPEASDVQQPAAGTPRTKAAVGKRLKGGGMRTRSMRKVINSQKTPGHDVPSLKAVDGLSATAGVPEHVVKMKTLPFQCPVRLPSFVLPDHLTVRELDDIEKASGCCSSLHTIMLTDLPNGNYKNEDVAKLVWPYFPKQNLHTLYYHVLVLPLQRRAFVFFADWTTCCHFVRDFIRKTISIKSWKLSVHFVLQHIGPESSEETMYTSLMNWSNAKVFEPQSLEERLLSVAISEQSMEVIKAVMEGVASVAIFVSFLPLANRICIEMADSSGLTKVLEKYSTFSPDSLNNSTAWSKVQRFESLKSLKQRLQDASEITITFESDNLSVKAVRCQTQRPPSELSDKESQPALQAGELGGSTTSEQVVTAASSTVASDVAMREISEKPATEITMDSAVDSEANKDAEKVKEDSPAVKPQTQPPSELSDKELSDEPGGSTNSEPVSAGPSSTVASDVAMKVVSEKPATEITRDSAVDPESNQDAEKVKEESSAVKCQTQPPPSDLSDEPGGSTLDSTVDPESKKDVEEAEEKEESSAEGSQPALQTSELGGSTTSEPVVTAGPSSTVASDVAMEVVSEKPASEITADAAVDPESNPDVEKVKEESSAVKPQTQPPSELSEELGGSTNSEPVTPGPSATVASDVAMEEVSEKPPTEITMVSAIDPESNQDVEQAEVKDESSAEGSQHALQTSELGGSTTSEPVVTAGPSSTVASNVAMEEVSEKPATEITVDAAVDPESNQDVEKVKEQSSAVKLQIQPPSQLSDEPGGSTNSEPVTAGPSATIASDVAMEVSEKPPTEITMVSSAVKCQTQPPPSELSDEPGGSTLDSTVDPESNKDVEEAEVKDESSAEGSQPALQTSDLGGSTTSEPVTAGPSSTVASDVVRRRRSLRNKQLRTPWTPQL